MRYRMLRQGQGMLLPELLMWKKSSGRENQCFQTQAEVAVCCSTQTFSRRGDERVSHLPAGNSVVTRRFRATNSNEHLKTKSRYVLVHSVFPP